MVSFWNHIVCFCRFKNTWKEWAQYFKRKHGWMKGVEMNDFHFRELRSDGGYRSH